MTKPTPSLDGPAARYWEAAREGRLELQRCRDCRHWIHFPDLRCPACGSAELGFEPAAGTGAVETFTVVHRVFVPGFEPDAPYAVGWIALDEQPGLRVFADLTGVRPENVHIGQRVTACFTERAGWGLMLSFAPDHPGESA
ncbi:Zn-ribbon domain-containing OB-fold protein [Dactylosporangium sp. CS-033363]|uniref:Zn-ribbon domain-containing OB-fold protein n=1 Tax=Dactylosporangium sp. CS-033363 TaxID=3239935 RepID=UPI003D928700